MIRHLIAVAALVLLPACRHTPPTTSPPAETTAADVKHWVDLARGTTLFICGLEEAAVTDPAITVCPGAATLPIRVVREVVTESRALDRILDAAANGWQPIVKTSWHELLTRIGPVSNASVALALGAVTAVVDFVVDTLQSPTIRRTATVAR